MIHLNSPKWGRRFAIVITISLADPAVFADEVSFSRDVLPVLSDRCFHCHGPDDSNREAELRLDLEADAKQDRGGYAAIAPGDLEGSEIWNRIVSEDGDTLMPPPDSHRKPLTAKERKAIRSWIQSGAQWGKHWSFETPSRPQAAIPNIHPIDFFVQARLTAAQLKFSAPAAPHTLLRRLTFDLTGLAPTQQEIKAFGDGKDQAWLTAIDRLLNSPQHAERMAMWWLDAARYSDSDGFQQDATRQNWPWRDWVIQQFQNNKSFKDFTIEQFAGDLLPNATADQKLATCFHRNHMTNGEGGRDPEESRIDYVIDRVNTTGTVWLGLTLGCVQCHSHKFDPISQHDYYSMSAFFNSIDEDGKAGTAAKPYLQYRSSAVDDRIAEMSQFVKQSEAEEAQARKTAVDKFEIWLQQTLANKPTEHLVWWSPTPEISSSDGTRFHVAPNKTVQTHGPKPRQDDYRVVLPVEESPGRVTGVRIDVLPHPSHVAERFSRGGNGEFALTSIRILGRRQGSPSETQLDVASAVADFEADTKRKTTWDSRYAKINKTLNDDARDGWTTEGEKTTQPHVGVYALTTPWEARTGDQLIVVLRHRSTHGNANIGRFRVSLASELGETVRRVDGDSPIAELIRTTQDSLQPNEKLRQRLLNQFLLGDEAYQKTAARLKNSKQQLAELKKEKQPRNVMVLSEKVQPRDTHVLLRGVWDAKGEVVPSAVLPSVLEWPTSKTKTRLDLANWIVDSKNPLTARVIVNHVWQLIFGQGLVRTTEDFGLQGELPTHPELLDWLAVELMEHDWNLQHIIRLIVTSKTYRQSSTASEELQERDPENRLLARAPRFRLPAWMIRDNALQASGLLNTAVGGPPLKPYQPRGVWAEITMGRFDYQPSLGPSQYRRTIYAFWRRSSAPTFLFDSAQRRVCEVGVRRTNTPLHALTLMNDLTMLEASRALADLAVYNKATGQDEAPAASRWKDGLQTTAIRILSRKLTASEMTELKSVWTATKDYYDAHIPDAVTYTTVGQQSPPDNNAASTTAAWMTVASLLFNLDEAMTRE